MKIEKLKWRNFTSWGNSWQELTFDKESSLTLLCGENGAGKCLSGDTIIEVDIDDLHLFNDFVKYTKKH